MPVCDFCSSTPIVRCYPAADFIAYQFDNVVGESVGGWAASQECAALIDAGDREGLASRSIAELIDQNPDMAEFRNGLIDQIAGLHEIFFTSRTGEGVPAA